MTQRPRPPKPSHRGDRKSFRATPAQPAPATPLRSRGGQARGKGAWGALSRGDMACTPPCQLCLRAQPGCAPPRPWGTLSHPLRGTEAGRGGLRFSHSTGVAQAVCATPRALHQGMRRQGSQSGKGVRLEACGNIATLREARSQADWSGGPPRVCTRVPCGAGCERGSERLCVRVPGCL